MEQRGRSRRRRRIEKEKNNRMSTGCGGVRQEVSADMESETPLISYRGSFSRWLLISFGQNKAPSLRLYGQINLLFCIFHLFIAHLCH